MTALLLGAHVSTAGGLRHAPGRGAAIGATVIQVFTKTPNQWREPSLTDEEVTAFGTPSPTTASVARWPTIRT